MGGMLGPTLLLRLLLVDTELFCSISFSKPETEPDLTGEGGVNCFGDLHTLSAKAQIYWESPSLCQDQPIVGNSRESKYATSVSG